MCSIFTYDFDFLNSIFSDIGAWRPTRFSLSVASFWSTFNVFRAFFVFSCMTTNIIIMEAIQQQQYINKHHTFWRECSNTKKMFCFFFQLKQFTILVAVNKMITYKTNLCNIYTCSSVESTWMKTFRGMMDIFECYKLNWMNNSKKVLQFRSFSQFLRYFTKQFSSICDRFVNYQLWFTRLYATVTKGASMKRRRWYKWTVNYKMNSPYAPKISSNHFAQMCDFAYSNET